MTLKDLLEVVDEGITIENNAGVAMVKASKAFLRGFENMLSEEVLQKTVIRIRERDDNRYSIAVRLEESKDD